MLSVNKESIWFLPVFYPLYLYIIIDICFDSNFSTFLRLIDLSMVQNLVLAILTILIPLAIAILSDLYSKKNDANEEFLKLDLNIVLDKVFNVKLFLSCVFLIFISLFLWQNLLSSENLSDSLVFLLFLSNH